jgi:hypothetical protein
VEKLLVTSQLLLLAEVVDACCSFLLSKLHPSNCLGMLLFAEAHACPELLRGAHEFFTVCPWRVFFTNEKICMRFVRILTFYSFLFIYLFL